MPRNHPDHQLRHRIAWRRLSAEDKAPRRDALLHVTAQPLVKCNDVKRGQMLSLVLMDLLDLNVEQRFGIHNDIRDGANALRENIPV